MYYKLPVKERIELMKSYRKANPDMSYQDMVNDYNTSYQKFDNGGKKQIPATRQDSLNIYNNSILLNNYYNQNKKYYEEKSFKPESLDEKVISPQNLEMLKKAHLLNSKVSTKNKNIIKNNTNSNIYYYSDLVPGMIDAKAPLGIIDTRIKPQGIINYTPKNPYEDWYNNPKSNLNDEKKLKEVKEETKKILETVSGYNTKTFYYDPIAVKPNDLLTEEERAERIKKYGYNGLPFKNIIKPIQSSQDTVRHWNFNGPNPVMEYYDKSGKLINKEFYTNAGPGGKRIQPLTNHKYGGIQQFDNGGKKEREPIYVTDKNDPRLRAYNDSLNLHKAGVEKINFGKRFPQASNETLNKIEDIINEKYPITPSKSSFGSNIIESTSWEIMGTGPAKRGVPQYTKPVQPYIYKKPKEQPIVNNTVQDSVKYLPLIKTIPTLTDSVRQPEIIQPKIIQSGLKQPEQKSTYQKVSFRYDPVSKLQVPVLLTDPKMKVEQGTRIYNKYIPTVTGALPSDFKPEFNKPEVYEKTDPYWRSKFINPNSGVKK